MPLPVGLLMGAVGGGRRLLANRRKKQTGAAVASQVTGKKKGAPVKTGSQPRVQPQQTLAPAAPSAAVGGGGGGSLKESALRIKVTTIEVNTLLKGALALDKMQAKNKKKTQEELRRTKAEDELESDNKGKASLPIPGAKTVKSFWERIKNFFLTMFWGMIGLKLLPLLPHLMKALPWIAKTADFLIDVGIGIVDVLASAIKVGYDAYDWTREQVKDKLGEGAAEKFDSFMGTMNKMVNLIMALGMAAAAAGGGGQKPKQPKRSIKNKAKRLKKKISRRFDPKRTQKLKRLKNIKKVRADRIKAEKILKRQRVLRKIRPTNLKRMAKVATGKPVRAAGGWMSRFGKSINTGWKATKGAAIRLGKGALNISKSGLKQLNGFRKGMMAVAGDAVQGVMAKGKEWAKSIGDIADMMKNPGKLVAKVKQILKGPMEGLLKENKFGKQLMKLKELAKDPKKAKDAINSLFKSAKKSKGLLKLREGLQAAKKSTKGIGGIDKVIAAIMGLLDYTVFGESPINAILKAVGALVGYSAGFAIGAPFGGAPGFVTGMAGGWVGEKAASTLAGLLSKTPLKDIDDPIAGAIDAMPDRKLVRDPAGGDLELTEEQQSHLDKELGGEPAKTGTKGEGGPMIKDTLGDKGDKEQLIKKSEQKLKTANQQGGAQAVIDSISTTASYEEGGEIVVVNESSSTQQEVPTKTKKQVGSPAAVGSGGGSDPYEGLYKGS